MLLQRLNIILTASAILDVFAVVSQAPFHLFLFFLHLFLLQVADQGAKDSVNCSGVLRSTPVPVNGNRCHNPVLYLSQLVSEKKTVPVVKIGELQQ